jgi:hypothetical protein
VARRDLALAIVLVACGGKADAGGGESFMDDLPPSTQCPGTSDTGVCAEDTSAVDESTAGNGEACTISEDCANGQSCVAPFDGEIGEFVCTPLCIGVMDELSWCADASACCDADAICTTRGYCVVQDGGTSGNGTTSADTSGTSGESSGGSAGSSG